ncbi:tRNA G18 (ribose-2'-O)-methylase SpoU [Arthrobacter ulcerisalmonis]|uniref:TrmH family RNA methyltransferase n=1 Tax=Arthrobacter sp. B1I2 TaxID=3042263 RepID=UPI00277F0C90|nr:MULTISPECIES: RNA methyltransferase [Arthrobacter]MDQ0664331.1 tRNA G18 (ribose-2'-O)-methylase SpoU [Arthrobacter ulcerisalmonis]MDQ0732241.1 tRNA G18 (ribose-2'-O)-methylase SpoU [Arthrobacter sp. B1I2]
MTFHYLESADDPRVSDYTTLTDVHLRKLREPAEGMYIAESSRVLRRALAAGHQPRSFFLAEKWMADLDDVFQAYPDVPAFIGSAALLEEITGFHLHRGAMAAMQRPAPVPLPDLLAGARRVAALEDIVDHTKVSGSKVQEPGRLGLPERSRIAVLEDLTDHTNVGAVFRSAAAIGVNAVLVTPQCADPLYRRSIRVSMGTVFQVPWTRIDPWPASIEQLKEAGYFVAGMSLGEGAITLDELVAQNHQNLVLVFGTEGDGLKPETDRLLDARVTIPMMNGVDSLNVAASSAVAFYATR